MSGRLAPGNRNPLSLTSKHFVCIMKISFFLTIYSKTCIAHHYHILLSLSCCQSQYPKLLSVKFFSVNLSVSVLLYYGVEMVKDLDPGTNFQAWHYLRLLTYPENHQGNQFYYFWINRQKFKMLDDGLLYGKQNLFLFPPESSCECLEQWRGSVQS